MGMNRSILQFIARLHKERPFAGPVLTLGRQNVYATPQEVGALLAAEGLAPASLPSGVSELNAIPEWRGTPKERNISDQAYFARLGLGGAQALDYSDFEGAEIVADLNKPLPAEFAGRFGLVVDGGTLEHVFNVPQALKNIVALLKPGGRVIHMVPANNFVNHGFYQFSPTLFFDYYSANGFTDLKGFLARKTRFVHEEAKQDYFEVPPAGMGSALSTPDLLEVAFHGEKGAGSTGDAVPIQNYYQRIYSSAEAAPARTGWRSRIPAPLKAFLLTWVAAGSSMNRLPVPLRRLMLRCFPFLRSSDFPSGMRRLGRFG